MTDTAATVSDFRSLFLQQRPLLDVRAPVEFSRGALPGSTNLPLMTDDERHQVGVRYKHAGQDEAIALGARLIVPAERERRTALWVEFARQNPDGALCCFRGGLRSRIAQDWMKEAGCSYPMVSGGYKAMRTWMLEQLPQLLARTHVMLVGGRTGTGKTLLLQRLPIAVDLEALARHRGSSFGGTATPQPGNIDFENTVTVELLRLAEVEHGKPVFLEDEARMIGRVCMPEALRNAMQVAPLIILETPLVDRIQHGINDYVIDLLAQYGCFDRFAEHHRSSLARVRKRLGGVNYAKACELLETAFRVHREHNDLTAYEPLIELLLTRYYDPMYDYQLSSKQERIVFQGSASQVTAWVSETWP